MHQGARPGLVLLLLVSVAWAGCIGDGPGTGDDAANADQAERVFEEQVVLPYNLTAARCAWTELTLDGEHEDAQRFLPPGVHVADLDASFVMVVTSCAGPDAPSGAYAKAELYVPIREPPVSERVRLNLANETSWAIGPQSCDRPGAIRHLYHVAGYSADRLWGERYFQAGIPTLSAQVTHGIDVMDGAGAERIGDAEAEAVHEGATVLSLRAAGTGGIGVGVVPDQEARYAECQYTWFEGAHGLLATFVVHRIDYVGAGTWWPLAGNGSCEVADDTPFASVVTIAMCAQAHASLITDQRIDGAAVWFQETTFVRP